MAKQQDDPTVRTQVVTGTAPAMPKRKTTSPRKRVSIENADNGGIIVEVYHDTQGSSYQPPTRNVYATWAEAAPVVAKLFGGGKS